MRRYHLSYIGTLSVIIFLCIFTGNYKKEVASSIDNRYLTKFPEQISEDLTKQLTDYEIGRASCRERVSVPV